MKLTQEHVATLRDLDPETWEALAALCQTGVDALAQRVLTADLAKGDREVVLARSALQGAHSLQTTILSARRARK